MRVDVGGQQGRKIIEIQPAVTRQSRPRQAGATTNSAVVAKCGTFNREPFISLCSVIATGRRGQSLVINGVERLSGGNLSVSARAPAMPDATPHLHGLIRDTPGNGMMRGQGQRLALVRAVPAKRRISPGADGSYERRE